MSETHDPSGPQPGAATGPGTGAPAAGQAGTATDDPGPQLNRDQVRDLDKLRRSSTDRYVAGVAGGLGRHFGIDPTILRVVFAAACFFGGAGLLLYAAVWLFVPEDNRAQAPIHTNGDTRRILLLIAAAIAALALVGDGWGGFSWTGLGLGVAWPLGIIAIIVAVIAGARRRTGMPGPVPGAQPAPPYAYAPTTPSAGDTGTTAFSATATPTWQPPAPPAPAAAYPPPVPPRQRRTGIVLFWPTLALLALGWGLLGIYDIDHHVAAGAWPALGLAIIGAMLVVGAFVGRPGGLILLGCLTLPVLSVTTVVDSLHWEDHTVRYTPTSTSQMVDDYRIGNGHLVVDLSRVADPAALAGRDIAVHFSAGDVEVYLPRGIQTDVSASLGFAGDIEIGQRDQSGFSPEAHELVNLSGTAATRPPLELDVHGHVGHIDIKWK